MKRKKEENMKRRTNFLYAVALVFTALFIFLQIQEVSAADQHASATCSNATLKGLYGFHRTGYTSDGPLAAVGIQNFDGTGKFTSRSHTSRNGVFESSKFSGRIQIAADCTAKVFAEDGVQLSSGVVVDNGNGLFLLTRTRGSSVVLVSRKIQTQ
jgi:hypothetical protein